MRRFLLVVAFLVGGWMVLHFFGPGEPELDSAQRRERVPFATDREPAPESKAVAFNGKRAMGYLAAICDIGPRMSGTAGMRRQQEVIQKHFEDLGAKVVMQEFTARQNSQRRAVPMTNMIVSFHPDRQRRVILCSHYDTRPIADQEPDPRKWREKFVSANDGGSGVAFLMELGQHMKNLKTSVGVDFVFFDGEEYIFDRDRDKYFFGSEHFAQTWKKSKPKIDYAAAILLDMIAGEEARFPAEGHSFARARQLVQEIWGLAGELGCRAFKDQVGQRVLDDHLALLNAGIPAIDIIDFEYPHWHRLSDVPANCSPQAMEQVARVLSVWLQRAK